MAYENPECEFTIEVGNRCTEPARFLVMTQIPPYTQAYACQEHLLIFVDRLMGSKHYPVIVRRVYLPKDWTWS